MPTTTNRSNHITYNDPPLNLAAIGFKSEGVDDDGFEIGPAYWITAEGDSEPVAVLHYGDDDPEMAGTTWPVWYARHRLYRAAIKLAVEVRYL